MSEENVEVVRSFYDAWARNEFPGPVELWTPRSSTSIPPGPWNRAPDAALLGSRGRLTRSSRGGKPGTWRRNGSGLWEIRWRWWCATGHGGERAASKWRAGSRPDTIVGVEAPAEPDHLIEVEAIAVVDCPP
jgi:hypothetical protein